MQITILCENETGKGGARHCCSQWGFSAFIHTKTANILFDTGHTDVYKRNASNLGIDLNRSDFVVLSHHHWDHTGGLSQHDFQDKKKLILHPQVLEKIKAKHAQIFKRDFDIIATKIPLEFAPDIHYLGEIPRKNSFEKGTHKGDSMQDDSAIAIKSEKGLIVITGCSHAGICNICEYAMEVTGQKLYAVLGGFHLTEKDQDAVNATVDYFKAQKVERLYPMHCVDFPTMVRFYNEFGIAKSGTGDVISL